MSIFSKIGSFLGKAVKKIEGVGAAVVGGVVKVGVDLVTGKTGAIVGDLVSTGKNVITAITKGSAQVGLGIFNSSGSAPKATNGVLQLQQGTSGIGIFNPLNGNQQSSSNIISPQAMAQAQMNPATKGGIAPASDNSLLIGGGLLGAALFL